MYDFFLELNLVLKYLLRILKKLIIIVNYSNLWKIMLFYIIFKNEKINCYDS